ncbi:MAG: TolA-binding protein [bacterium]|jgi:TolA-binding protein
MSNCVSKVLLKVVSFSLLLCFLYLPLLSAKTIIVSPKEKEDRDFIRHLFRDELYYSAQREANIYLKAYTKGVFRAESHFILAQIFLIEKQPQKALQNFDAVIQKYARSPYLEDSLFLAGTLRVDLKQFIAGKKNLQQLVTQFPKTPLRKKISYALGKIAFHEKDWKHAEQYLLQASNSKITKKGKRQEAQYLLAWSLHSQKLHQQAEPLFTKLVNGEFTTAQKAAMMFQIALYARDRKEFQKAITLLEKQIKEFPDEQFQYRSQFWIAELIYLRHQNNPKQVLVKEQNYAIDLFTKNINREKPIEAVRSRYHRGWLYYYQKKTFFALHDFRWLQENHKEYKKDLDLTLIRSQFYEKRKRWKIANKILQNGVTSHHSDKGKQTILYLRIVRNLVSLKQCRVLLKTIQQVDFSEAKKHIQELESYRGECYYKQKKWKLAIQSYEKVGLNYEFSRMIYPHYLYALKKNKNWKRALQIIDQGLTNPKLGTASHLLNQKADFLLQLKQWKKAKITLQRIWRKFPKERENSAVLINLAVVYDKLRNKSRSTWYYEKALSRVPKRQKQMRLSIIDILRTRYEKQRKYKKLVSLYEKSIPLLNHKQKLSTTLYIAKAWNFQLKNKKIARRWYLKLHLKGDTHIHYEASTLLAEMEIGLKRYNTAIRVLKKLSKRPIRNTRWYIPVHHRLAQIYQFREKWKLAASHYSIVARRARNRKTRKVAKEQLVQIKNFLSIEQ